MLKIPEPISIHELLLHLKIDGLAIFYLRPTAADRNLGFATIFSVYQKIPFCFNEFQFMNELRNESTLLISIASFYFDD